MPLEDTMKDLQKLNEGVTPTWGASLGVNESTMLTIEKNKAIMECGVFCHSSLLHSPGCKHQEMETELTFWVKDGIRWQRVGTEDGAVGGRERETVLKLKAICSHPKCITTRLVETTRKGNPDKFHGEKGWLGESLQLAKSNVQWAPTYSRQLQKLIRARTYVPHRVFHAQGRSLFGSCTLSVLLGEMQSRRLRGS